MGSCQARSSCASSRYEAQISLDPNPSGCRGDAKNSQCSSRESAGAKSLTEPLTVDPRLTGLSHGQLSSAQARWATQTLRSGFTSPGSSGRPEAKYRRRPSLDSVACWSLKPSTLIGGPRGTGSDQAEKPSASFSILAASSTAYGRESGEQGPSIIIAPRARPYA